MKLYAIRDRLLNYFQQPFAAHSDQVVLASLATLVNNPESSNDIARAPQHFEIWRLAEINDQTGKVTGDPEYLNDATSLVRTGLRERIDAGNPALDAPTGSSQMAPQVAPGNGGAKTRALANAAPATPGEGGQAHPAHPGGAGQSH